MSNGIRIFYVEDEPFLGKIVRESLESRGYEVQMEIDGLQAVQALKSYTPDICILDVMLPGMDGFALGTRVRQLYPDVPIIFLTAKSQVQDVVKGFESGGNDYIRKPFSMEELIVRVQNLLKIVRTPSPSGNDSISIGSFHFLPVKQELQSGDHVRKISYREVQVLQILSQHRNQTVQRKDVLLAVWGDDSFFNSRNLDVYITRLREYFKGDPSIQIVTLKGVGYCLVV